MEKEEGLQSDDTIIIFFLYDACVVFANDLHDSAKTFTSSEIVLKTAPINAQVQVTKVRK